MMQIKSNELKNKVFAARCRLAHLEGDDLVEGFDVSLVDLSDELGVGLQQVVQRLEQLVLRQRFRTNVGLRWSRNHLLLDDVRSLEHGWSDQSWFAGRERARLLKLHRLRRHRLLLLRHRVE